MPATLIHSRPIIERLAVIHRCLMAGQPFTTGELADQLEVSYKTIDRDIQFLRDRIGYEITYDATHRCWRGQAHAALFPLSPPVK